MNQILNLHICDSLYEKGPLHALNQFAERQFKSRKKKIFFLNFIFLTCTRSRAFQLAPRQISPEVSPVWLSYKLTTRSEFTEAVISGN